MMIVLLRVKIMATKFRKKRNYTAKALLTKKFSSKVIKAKKGKGSFIRIKK